MLLATADLGRRLLDPLVPTLGKADALHGLLDLLNAQTSSGSLEVILILIRSTLKVNQTVDLVDPGSETDR